MHYTVWYAGTLIGRTELAATSALPSVRLGQLVPAPEFVGAWVHIGPVMTEFMAATMAMASPLSEISHAPDDSPAERGQRIHDRLDGAPRWRADARRYRSGKDSRDRRSRRD